MNNILSFIVSTIADASPVQILLGTNAALTAAMGALYRDCRKDREKLWQHVKDLEKRVNRR